MKLWIARDKDDMLYLYENEPKIVYSNANYFDDANGECYNLPTGLFPEVTFENSPQEVELKLVEKMANGFDKDLKITNKTPLVYNDILFENEERETFLNELSNLYNKYGLDSKLNIRDFLLAEMTFNFLAVINNTIYKEFEMKIYNIKL